MEPYLQEFLNINNLDGKLSTQLQIQGNTEHLTDIVAIGNIHLNQVQANNSYEEQIARFDELSIYIDKIDLHSKQFYFDSISINGLNVDYTLLENRNTFSNLLDFLNSLIVMPSFLLFKLNFSSPLSAEMSV